MDAVTTIWNCTKCNKSGNIITLHNYLRDNKKQIQKQRIYNHKRERSEIISKLERASKKYKDQSLLKLVNKVEKLIDFYKKEPSGLCNGFCSGRENVKTHSN